MFLANSYKKDVQQNSPTISTVMATLRKSSSPTAWSRILETLNRLSSAPCLLLSWVTSCPPLASVKGLTSFIDANKPLSRVFPTAPNLSIHLNLPWSSYNLMTCFSGMKTFAKHLLLLSFLVLLINFGLSPMPPWPREVLEPLVCHSTRPPAPRRLLQCKIKQVSGYMVTLRSRSSVYRSSCQEY